MNDQYVKNVVEAALLAAGRPLSVEELVGVFDERDESKPEDVAQPVSRLWQERPAKYSRALLETLALVAYRQPITRGEIEQIRGVAVNPNIIKTLLERNWIRVVGHRDVPGKPELLGTTREFLDYFSLKKLDDLPTLAQLKELEELRVQLTLPGAGPESPTPDLEAAVPPEAFEMEAQSDEDDERPPQDSAERTSGLVARGVQDDAN
jgi:segregation and condensation protein B